MISRIPQAPPQNCLARTMPGSSGDLGISANLSVPQPTITPHWTMTMKIPKRITAPLADDDEHPKEDHRADQRPGHVLRRVLRLLGHRGRALPPGKGLDGEDRRDVHGAH